MAGIRDEICAIQKCQDEMKGTLQDIIKLLQTGNDTVIKELCEKVEVLQDAVDEIADEVLGDCPMELIKPLTSNSAVVDGDQTAANPAGSTFEVKDAAGNVTGTATVASAAYDATSNTTTFTLTNNTVPAAALAGAKSVTKQRVAAKEDVKKEETATEAVATRG